MRFLKRLSLTLILLLSVVAVYEGGIKEFVHYLNKSKEPLYENILYFEGTKNGVYVEVALQHNDSYNESTYSFVNHKPNSQ